MSLSALKLLTKEGLRFRGELHAEVLRYHKLRSGGQGIQKISSLQDSCLDCDVGINPLIRKVDTLPVLWAAFFLTIAFHCNFVSIVIGVFGSGALSELAWIVSWRLPQIFRDHLTFHL